MQTLCIFAAYRNYWSKVRICLVLIRLIQVSFRVRTPTSAVWPCFNTQPGGKISKRVLNSQLTDKDAKF